jgi:hypothetical protein
MAAVERVDRTAPLFFLSYARSPSGGQAGPARDRDRYVNQFFADLTEDVAQLVSRPTGAEPGFMERSMAGGNFWQAELLHAIGTCQVFIALLSRPYVMSQWCGMEWHAFSRRRVSSKERGAQGSAVTSILPVIWAPFPEEEIPEPIRDTELFSPGGLPDPAAPLRYHDDGIFGLMETASPIYNIAVWHLARRVAGLYYSFSVEPSTPRPNDLRDVFTERRQ